jgi:branched-chain amino acid transport system substrate-binding protein
MIQSQPKNKYLFFKKYARLFALIIIFSFVCSIKSFIDPHRSWGNADETIKIALIVALTGPAAMNNHSTLVGTEIAVTEINRNGGLLGKKLELLVFDNKSTPIDSDRAAHLAVQQNISAIVGAVWSSHSVAIARVAQEYRIPMISPFSSLPALTSIGDEIFRVCYTDTFQGTKLAEFARNELGAVSALIFINLTSDYSMEFARIFRARFEALGGNISKEIEYKPNQAPFDGQINSAAMEKSDVILLSGHDESGYLAAKLQDVGTRGIPLGGDGWGEGDFYITGGNRLQKAFFLTQWDKKIANPYSHRFVATYGDREKLEAGTALAYDAVHVLATAIKTAGITDREQIRRSLAKTVYTEGVTGMISFDSHRDPIKEAVVIEIRNGIPHYLKTLSQR